MMAQTAVENEFCNACDADVRLGALFCYNCGGAVAAEKTNAAFVNNNSAADSLEEKTDKEGWEKKPILIKEVSAAEESTNRKKTTIQEQTKPKSAAALRRKSKSFQPKIVEVVWEEHENAPNIWFLSVSVVLTILAIVILFMAMYLK